jgi:hypothetical protein
VRIGLQVIRQAPQGQNQSAVKARIDERFDLEKGLGLFQDPYLNWNVRVARTD